MTNKPLHDAVREGDFDEDDALRVYNELDEVNKNGIDLQVMLLLGQLPRGIAVELGRKGAMLILILISEYDTFRRTSEETNGQQQDIHQGQGSRLSAKSTKTG